MEGDLFQLLYVSSAARAIADTELMELLQKTRIKNLERGITGILLYCDGNFIQLLEGEKAVVESLFERIKADERHRGVLRLFCLPCARREFPDWSMGFRRVDGSIAEVNIPGFNRLMEHDSADLPELSNLSKRVSLFIQTFRRTAGIGRYGNDDRVA